MRCGSAASLAIAACGTVEFIVSGDKYYFLV